MLLRRFSTKQLPSSNIHDFLVKANAYHPKQTFAIASSQHMLHLLHPYLEQKTTSSPFTKIAMERKLSHWKTLTTNSKDTENVKLPTLDARGMHFWTQSNEEKIGSNVALSFSHAISEYLPEEKVHRTTLPDFLGFVRQQLKTWQDQRRTDMMTPDVLDVNLDGGDNDPIIPVVDALSVHVWLLQIDYWNVSSVTDAMLMRRVFARLFNSGTFVVTSGNVPVDQFQATELQEKKYKPTQVLFRRRIFSEEI